MIKRIVLIIVPIILFMLLNACVSNAGASGDPWPAWLQTITATAWTPTITPTSFNSSTLVNLLNTPLPEDYMLQRVNELERTIGAHYPVVDVKYEVENKIAILKVEVHCQCAAQSDCCSPERMFVKIIRSMEVNRELILQVAPTPVNEMHVYCLDHGEQLAIMVASWQDVKDYLNSLITPSQFGSRVRRK